MLVSTAWPAASPAGQQKSKLQFTAAARCHLVYELVWLECETSEQMLVGFLTDANVDANAWIRETCQALASQNLALQAAAVLW